MIFQPSQIFIVMLSSFKKVFNIWDENITHLEKNGIDFFKRVLLSKWCIKLNFFLWVLKTTKIDC